MLNRLISMGILAHVHDLHFPHLMNHTSAFHSFGTRYNENRIQHLNKSILSTHQVNQPLRIMKNAKAPMPGVTFCVFACPSAGVKGFDKLSGFGPSAHQGGLVVIQALVVSCALGITLQLGFLLFLRLTKPVYAPVGVCVFEGTGNILVEIFAKRTISMLIIPVNSG